MTKRLHDLSTFATVTLTFDLEGEGIVLFPMVDFMGEHVKTKASIFLG